MSATTDPVVDFVGHPFSSTGKGEELRAAFSAYTSLDPSCRVVDAYRFAERSDDDHLRLIKDRESRVLGGGVRVFHINGDEVDNVLSACERRGADLLAGTNVIVPAWELPVYPAVWADALRRFDEVWAISRFVGESLAAAGIASEYVGQSVELPARPFLPPRHFGIRASAFVFLTMFDLSSYSTRKNPLAAVEMYQRLRKAHPYADMQLVLKVKDGDRSGRAWIEGNLDTTAPDLVLIDSPLKTHEIHSLIAACDCLVSLHRSEGFGRGVGEAMWLGRTAIATAWSGNLDFMDHDYPGAVRYSLVPVGEREYPHHHNQIWAEPDIDHAFWIASRLLEDHALRRKTIAMGKARVLQTVSHRAVGLRMLDRIEWLTQ